MQTTPTAKLWPLAPVEGGLLLTQVNRDPNQLRESLDVALGLLRSEQ